MPSGSSRVFLLQRERLRIWLHENTNMCIEGVILGTDEFMNLLLDNAAEVNTKHNTTKPIGRILLKGDNIVMITAAPTA